MRQTSFWVIVAAILVGGTCAYAQNATSTGKVCHMEQQCHWENFQKHCVWVKVCR